jgi:hypothetical protein
MEVPAVEFAAYCLGENTTAVKGIDELGHTVEAAKSEISATRTQSQGRRTL